MFCTTFYSYKGGVGRTLALANVAVTLAQRNKKVLIVDFDLEAPGLSTVNIFANARGKQGMVEFVQEFIETGVVANVENYIYPCEFTDPSGKIGASYKISILPAGSDLEYPNRYADIDWGQLYAEKSGFLLVEDLRQQWLNLGYDYVLVDSRTGLTDAGGICTRQLPDLVVIVFFPNEQNLAGLKKVVSDIRSSSARSKSIELLFVGSRLPKLDDEDEILKRWLDRFRKELDYDDDEFCRVDHYDSLALLDQEVFALARPRSGLARQYRRLGSLIARENVEDPDGAFSFLAKLLSSEDDIGEGGDKTLQLSEHDRKKIVDIGNIHSSDYVIQFMLANLYDHELAEMDLAAVASEKAFQAFGTTRVSNPPRALTFSRLNQARIGIFSNLGDDEALIASAAAILNDVEASEQPILSALLVYARKAPGQLGSLAELPALKNFSAAQLATLAKRLPAASNVAAIAAELADLAVNNPADDLPSSEAFEMVNILISGKRFETAVKAATLIEANVPIEKVGKLFNGAMAKWGRDGAPTISDFEEVLKLGPAVDGYQDEPNFVQCLALAAAVVGSDVLASELASRAIDLIQSKGLREFSCWRYSVVAVEVFEDDCRAIVDFSKGIRPAPPAVTKAG